MVYKSEFPFFLSIDKAPSTDLGTHISNLCVIRQYLAFNLAIIMLQCIGTSLTHHLKAGFIYKRFPDAYLVNSTVLDAFKYLRGIQIEDPSFHSTKRSHPHVVFFGTMLTLCRRIMPSEIGLSNRSFLWLVVSCITW